MRTKYAENIVTVNCIVNNGLSEASKAQLVGKTGEEIVDADIALQMGEKS